MMKKTLCLVIALMMLLCSGCGKEKADVPVMKLAWSLSAGENEGHSYMYLQMTNNTDITIIGSWMTFRIRDGAAQHEREQFLHDLQDSQGFDDAFMQTFLTNLANNGGELTMTASVTQPLQPGQTTNPIQCYYMGGWTSRDLIYPDLFEPKSLTVSYQKEGQAYEQIYDFKSETYTTQPAQQTQQ